MIDLDNSLLCNLVVLVGDGEAGLARCAATSKQFNALIAEDWLWQLVFCQVFQADAVDEASQCTWKEKLHRRKTTASRIWVAAMDHVCNLVSEPIPGTPCGLSQLPMRDPAFYRVSVPFFKSLLQWYGTMIRIHEDGIESPPGVDEEVILEPLRSAVALCNMLQGCPEALQEGYISPACGDGGDRCPRFRNMRARFLELLHMLQIEKLLAVKQKVIKGFLEVPAPLQQDACEENTSSKGTVAQEAVPFPANYGDGPVDASNGASGAMPW
mmetsp:Transcript_65748/g.119957  ORF Transcript_65748/g.119957 Transcript_65748/m.119957 type:complete len:269 (-) Transcript_65748:202-1008(-)